MPTLHYTAAAATILLRRFTVCFGRTLAAGRRLRQDHSAPGFTRRPPQLALFPGNSRGGSVAGSCAAQQTGVWLFPQLRYQAGENVVLSPDLDVPLSPAACPPLQDPSAQPVRVQVGTVTTLVVRWLGNLTGGLIDDDSAERFIKSPKAPVERSSRTLSRYHGEGGCRVCQGVCGPRYGPSGHFGSPDEPLSAARPRGVERPFRLHARAHGYTYMCAMHI